MKRIEVSPKGFLTHQMLSSDYLGPEFQSEGHSLVLNVVKSL